MKTYLLIGGIGSGKSTVAHLLAARGAAVIDLDAVGHAVLHDAAVKADLIAAFGREVLDTTGEVNRAALAAAAFASAQGVAQLNAITHPRIQTAAQARLAELDAAGVPLAIVEVSAYEGPVGLFGALEAAADGVIAVVAPEEVRIARAVARGMTESDAHARAARQPTDAQRLAWATCVVENAGGMKELETAVDALMGTLI